MAKQITVNYVSGNSPFEVYACDITVTYCYLVTNFVSVPPTLTLSIPPPLENTNDIVIKVIDSLGCSELITFFCSPTPTQTPTQTPTPTMTVTPGLTPTVTPTPSKTPTQTPIVTTTQTPTNTNTPSITPTNTNTPSITPSITTTPSVTPTVTQTVTPTITQTPTLTPTPSPVPAPYGIYYGKFSGSTITSGEAISNLSFITTNDPTNNFVTYPLVSGYGYILIPVTLPQPTGFQESNSSCSGLNIPTNNIGTLIIIDINGFPITYNIYRTFYSFGGSVDCWLCN